MRERRGFIIHNVERITKKERRVKESERDKRLHNVERITKKERTR